MRLVHRRRGEEALIGRHQRQPEPVGQRNQPRLDGTFQLQAMPVQFHRHPRAKGVLHPLQQPRRLRLTALPQQARDPARVCRRSAGTTPPPARPQPRNPAAAPPDRRVRNPAEDSRCKFASPASVCASSHHRIAQPPGARERDLAANDRLHPGRRAVAGKLERTEQIARVGDRHSGHLCVACQGRDLVGVLSHLR